MKLRCRIFGYWSSIPIFTLFILFNLGPSVLAQDKVASLHPPPDLVWQRTSPSSTALEGPVLYQIIFRSSATPGSVPKISNRFTLTNSLITDNGTMVAIGGMAVNGGSGIITFAGGQTFPGTGGGSVTSLSAGQKIFYGQVSIAVAFTAVDMAPGPAALLEACAVTVTVPTAP